MKIVTTIRTKDISNFLLKLNKYIEESERSTTYGICFKDKYILKKLDSYGIEYVKRDSVSYDSYILCEADRVLYLYSTNEEDFEIGKDVIINNFEELIKIVNE